MSDTKHSIVVGADTPIHVFESGIELLSPSFTFDRTDIYFDSTIRTIDEILV